MIFLYWCNRSWRSGEEVIVAKVQEEHERLALKQGIWYEVQGGEDGFVCDHPRTKRDKMKVGKGVIHMRRM